MQYLTPDENRQLSRIGLVNFETHEELREWLDWQCDDKILKKKVSEAIWSNN